MQTKILVAAVYLTLAALLIVCAVETYAPRTSNPPDLVRSASRSARNDRDAQEAFSGGFRRVFSTCASFFFNR